MVSVQTTSHFKDFKAFTFHFVFPDVPLNNFLVKRTPQHSDLLMPRKDPFLCFHTIEIHSLIAYWLHQLAVPSLNVRCASDAAFIAGPSFSSILRCWVQYSPASSKTGPTLGICSQTRYMSSAPFQRLDNRCRSNRNFSTTSSTTSTS